MAWRSPSFSETSYTSVFKSWQKRPCITPPLIISAKAIAEAYAVRTRFITASTRSMSRLCALLGKRIFKESLIQSEHLNSQAGLFVWSRQHPDQPIHRAFVKLAFKTSGIRLACFAVAISNISYWRPPSLSSKNTGIADWLTR